MAEIEVGGRCERPKPLCLLCNIRFENIKKYVQHCRTHRHDRNVTFPCYIERCGQICHSYKGLISHVSRQHNDMSKVANRYQSCDTSFRCTLNFCQHGCADFQELMAHLRQHIDSGLKVTCPSKDCIRQFHIKSSFTSHISRYHKNYTAHNIDSQYVINQETLSHCLNEDISSPSSVMCDSVLGPDIFSNDEDTCNESPVAQFTKSIALFLLKLQSKNLLPESTIQEIVEELYLLNQMTYENFEKCLKTKLEQLEILNNEEKDKLIQEIISDEMSMLWCSLAPSPIMPNLQFPELGVLRSSYMRKLYFTREFNVICPIAIPLVESDSGKRQFCHYVPILESLKSFWEDKSVQRNINHTYCNSEEDNLYSDVRSGCVFQQNDYFRKFPNALQIILFQDSFEVVNPLGSAKTKHKVLAVYYTIGNLDPRCRSIIDPIQLVLLCKEMLIKQCGQKMVFSRFIEDLKYLEETGILLDTGEFLKGTVVSITGDNLGSHFIGGFCEGFNAQYFCRYCSLSKSEICEGKHYKEGLYRTKERHMNIIQMLEESDSDHIEGVKFNSVFNSLVHFHVASPGLPPCLGHDLFEGLVDYDLALFIDYFVQQKWFTYESLNKNLSKFPFCGPDATNMLKAISKGKKIGGQAVQNWWFIRFFPLVIFNNIKDTKDAVWQLSIKLKEIVEIVVSPRIHASQIAYLKVLVEEYLEERTDLFPNVPLRPKHHFLSHYHWLITMFGPLIRLWTMRFESKHSFFKRCARYSQNFINITFTLSEKHQLLQGFCSNGQLFPEKIKLLKGIQFHLDLYSLQSRQAVSESQVETDDCLVSDEVLIFGTRYKKGMFLLVAGDSGNIEFVSVMLVILSQGCVHFVVRHHSSHFFSDYGIYEVDSSLYESDVVACMPFDSILDHYPLSGYRVKGATMITLKHKPGLQI